MVNFHSELILGICDLDIRIGQDTLKYLVYIRLSFWVCVFTEAFYIVTFFSTN